MSVEARKMRPSLVYASVSRGLCGFLSHWPAVAEVTRDPVISRSWRWVGWINRSVGSTRPHLPTEANSQERPLGIQDRT